MTLAQAHPGRSAILHKLCCVAYWQAEHDLSALVDMHHTCVYCMVQAVLNMQDFAMQSCMIGSTKDYQVVFEAQHQPALSG